MPENRKKKVSVLFVCLGNICRSPTAQAVFESQIKQAGLQQSITVDSCGTASWHIGESPDKRSQAAAKKRGYSMSHLKGRQLEPDDFLVFDYILAMDKENLSNIKKLARGIQTQSHISLFLDFHPETRFTEVPDPYYGGDKGFENVLDLIELAGLNLLDDIHQKFLN